MAGGRVPSSHKQAPLQRPRKSSRSEDHAGDFQDCHPEQSHPRKIFVGGLAHKTTTQHLREYFTTYGSIVDAVVLRWPDGRSRGFGYVTFATTEAAAVALGGSHQIGGRDVDVKRAVPGTNKLFVGGLPQNTNHVDLRDHFEAYGVVSDAVVMIDPTTNRSRGFGFVCFLPGQDGAAAVASALEQYSSHYIRGKWIEVKSATPPHKLVAAKEETERMTAISTRSTTPSGSEASSRGSLRELPSSSPTPTFEHQEIAMGRTPSLKERMGAPLKVSLHGLAATASCPLPSEPVAYVGPAPAMAPFMPGFLPGNVTTSQQPFPQLAFPPGLSPFPAAAEDGARLAAMGVIPTSLPLTAPPSEPAPSHIRGATFAESGPTVATYDDEIVKRNLKETLEALLDFDAASVPVAKAVAGKGKTLDIAQTSPEAAAASRYAADLRGG
mmetsp:Transcript_39555/g.93125  ORF Transcript_39555/g.93125 Transcript_39555/m.93125 type:complete len:439 (+) Transcript_39555:92-1408(+)|eukprot:CAMPEP_0178430646 /NCGR_PEP_ID=MMETSP0689_2-20121128/31430_1 /TAXON_ID=160604 /ORGANISM="Amphidinium massartii, Strain CS-259" /LENGTH=438 /DNA_ID=CAMNT_0020052515 /DNA_START=67 /DNA_END=1383 /DNA_ORIENTATION=-